MYFFPLFTTEGIGSVEQEASKPKGEKGKKRTTSVGKRTVFSISETRQMKLLGEMYSEILLTLATNT